MVATSLSLLENLRQTNASWAWKRFVDLYTPLIYHWVNRFGLPPEDTADLVQEILLLLVKKLPEFHYDQNRSFRAWLRTVAVNKSRDFLRQRKRGPRTDRTVAYAESATPDPSDVFVEQEYRQKLAARALELMQQEFEETTWRACWAMVVDGRRAEDVATELQISVNAVYLSKGRVLRRLRQQLEGLWE